MDLTKSHRDLIIVQSEIIFLKKEMEFLLKILGMGYSQSTSLEKIKTLDGYQRDFENKIIDLNRILTRIIQGEREIVENYRNGVAEINERICPVKELQEVKQEIMILKDSFYDYLHEEDAHIKLLKNGY